MSGDDATTALRALAALVAVVVLVIVSARIARRASKGGDGVGLRVVDRVGLTRETAIAVVEVGGRGLVVGTSAHGVTLLTELEPGQLAAARRERRGTDPGKVSVTRVVAGQVPAQSRAQSQTQTRTQPQSRTQSRTRTQAPAGTGSVLDPRTWRQTVDTLRDLTVRRG